MDMGTPQVRRLIRRTDNKMIAGVAGGLGDYFGVDPVWFRLGFALAVLAGGAGFVAYAVLWIVMPTDAGATPSAAERGLERAAGALRGTPIWIGAALVIFGAVLVLNQALEWRPAVVWGIALIILGVLFFVPREERAAARLGSPRPRLPLAPSGATDTAVLEPTLPPAAAVPPPPPRVRERSTLGFMTFGAMLVSLGVVILLDLQEVIELQASQYLAVALGVIGLGLLVGSVAGRARWLIVPGIVLVPFVLAASLIHVPFTGGFGQRTYRPAILAPAVNEYHLIAGEMTIDLRGLLPAGPYKIEATTVAGRILILLPEGAKLDIDAKVGGGQIDLFGQHDEGVNVHVIRQFNLGSDQDRPFIEIDVEAGLGQVEVQS